MSHMCRARRHLHLGEGRSKTRSQVEAMRKPWRDIAAESRGLGIRCRKTRRRSYGSRPHPRLLRYRVSHVSLASPCSDDQVLTSDLSFPFFAEATMLDQWDRVRLSTSRATFAQLMSICALSSCHVRDGAMFTLPLAMPLEARLQQAYLEDARRAIPADVPAKECFAYLQSLGTLSLAAIQLGDASLLHLTLGQYHTVMAQHQFHNESKWPSTISVVERHVRRQFFWSMYRLEVHSALIMGHVVRCPEMQSAVSYPTMSDEMAGHITGSRQSAAGIPFGGWLAGWNYITDLYRVLEHVIVRFRSRKLRSVDRGTLYVGFDSLAPPIDDVLNRVLRQRSALPTYLANAALPSDDIESNLCGFQVANIACTIQVTMVTSSCEGNPC